ncbi:helix-turn-helix transcriptional regulator [Streptomyces sp. 184]|uniref:helix-turn-helix transcriptional regulator n=1 Tax=Streptomyces sp. 184 TaxID=1827526 RepID=UPI0038915A63
MSVGGGNMKRLRLQRGWTQARVAREMLRVAGIRDSEPVTHREINRYECGRRSPREWLPVIAEVFGVSVDDLTTPPLQTDETTDDYATSIRELSARLVELDNERHGLPIADTAALAFKRVHRQLGTGDHGRDVQAAAAELAEIAGWALYGAARYEAARRYSQEALLLAQLSGDRSIELITLQNIALVAGHTGSPGIELAIARSVLARGQLAPRVEAMFRGREAQGLALTGNTSEAKRSLARARVLLSDGGSSGDPPWSWWVTDRELDRQEARTLWATDRWREAVPVLRRALEPDSVHVGYRNIAAVWLLDCLVHLKAWRESTEEVEYLAQVVPEMAGVVSRQLLSRTAGKAKADPSVPSSLRDGLEHLEREATADPYAF